MSKQQIDEWDEYTEDEIQALQVFSDKEALGSIKKEDLIFDQYCFTITDVETNINNKEMGRLNNHVEIFVFPFIKKKTTCGYSTELASYIEDGESFNCSATSPYGRKTTVVKTEKNCFVINGRWVKENFLSYVNTMGDVVENRDVTFEKKEYRGSENSQGHLIINLNNWIVYIMPLSFINHGIYVPLMIILKDTENNETYACATQTYFDYEDIKIACHWYENELVCFKL